MEARNFKEKNVVFAEDQEEYTSLPALFEEEDGKATFSFKLSEEEIKQIVETGTIYLSVLTFGRPLQPIGPSLLNPFANGKEKIVERQTPANKVS